MSVSTECQFPLLTFQNGKYKIYFSVFMATLDKTYRRMATTITSFDRTLVTVTLEKINTIRAVCNDNEST